uniref:Uncharacterized protein n=1 Tax=Arundo donax TaxID=35708 RepID=A0A0A8ZWC3_ARUDO
MKYTKCCRCSLLSFLTCDEHLEVGTMLLANASKYCC